VYQWKVTNTDEWQRLSVFSIAYATSYSKGWAIVRKEHISSPAAKEQSEVI
jgi:hypothetical protein